jgi:hypothetical protein
LRRDVDGNIGLGHDILPYSISARAGKAIWKLSPA